MQIALGFNVLHSLVSISALSYHFLSALTSGCVYMFCTYFRFIYWLGSAVAVHFAADHFVVFISSPIISSKIISSRFISSRSFRRVRFVVFISSSVHFVTFQLVALISSRSFRRFHFVANHFVANHFIGMSLCETIGL